MDLTTSVAAILGKWRLLGRHGDGKCWKHYSMHEPNASMHKPAQSFPLHSRDVTHGSQWHLGTGALREAKSSEWSKQAPSHETRFIWVFSSFKKNFQLSPQIQDYMQLGLGNLAETVLFRLLATSFWLALFITLMLELSWCSKK